MIGDLRKRAPVLSALVISTRALQLPISRRIASAIFLGSFKLTAAIVYPLPLRKAPSAPASSAVAITRDKNGINFFRKGWCK